MKTFKLDELASAAGVSSRTVRYYVQRGLLPPPAFRGKDTTYDEMHLARLRAIRALQDASMPLDEILAHVEGKSERELGELGSIASKRGAAGGPYRSSAEVSTDGAQVRAPGAYQDPGTRWSRLELAPGVELHVRDDLGPESRAVAEAALAAARALPKSR